MHHSFRSTQHRSIPHLFWKPLALLAVFAVISASLGACGAGGGGVSSSQLTISSQGGTYSQSGITIQVPAGAASSEITLTLERVEGTDPLPAEVAYLSPVYNLSGQLDGLAGEVQVTFEIPDQALEDDSLSGEELAGTFFALVLEDYDPATGPGEAFPGYKLPVEVDLAAKTATVRLFLDDIQAGISRAKLSAPSLLDSAQAAGRKSIALRLGRTWTLQRTLVSQQGNFQAVFSSALSVNAVDGLLEMLEFDKLLIEEIGLFFTARTSYPIPVNLDDLGGKDGYFSGSYFVNSRELNIHSKFLQGAGQEDVTHATAGHELFHLVESLYYPQDYSYGRNFEVFDWLDEASATWFEAVVLGDTTWSPSVALTNDDFFQTPLNFPEDSAEHGYGASWYLRYLTQEAGLGNALIADIYKAAFNSGGNNTPSGAVDSAIEGHGTASRDTWPGFLATYLLGPEKLGSMLDTRKFLDNLQLGAVYDEDNAKTALTFGPTSHSTQEISLYNPDYTLGFPDESESFAQVTLQRSLPQLTGAAVLLSVNANDDLTKQTLSDPGKLRIDFSTGGIFSGVAVYGIPSGNNLGTAVPLAAPGGTSGYLGRDAYSLEVRGFGTGGAYEQIALIFYNADPTAAGIQPEDISVTLTYEPLTQCLDYDGELIIDSAAYTAPPCQAYEHCPDPSFSCGADCGMGEGNDMEEGLADCSTAPTFCWEDAVVSDLVAYMQPGSVLPIRFRLENVGSAYEAEFEFDYRNNDDAGDIMAYMYNYAQIDAMGMRTTLNEQNISFSVPYGSGVLTLQGVLGDSEGSGAFTLSHPALGNFVSGSWTAACVE